MCGFLALFWLVLGTLTTYWLQTRCFMFKRLLRIMINISGWWLPTHPCLSAKKSPCSELTNAANGGVSSHQSVSVKKVTIQ